MNKVTISRFGLGLMLAGSVLIWPVGCKRAVERVAGSSAIPVQIAVAEQRDVPITQISIGSVQALRTVAVKSQVDGVLAEIHFREGDEVKAGDLLVTLDKRPFENMLHSAQASLATAQAQLAQAEADEKRYQHLDQQQVVSQEELLQYRTKAETSRAAIQAEEANLANAQLQLSYAEIRAPISGRTGQLAFHEGALIKANDATAAIVTINQVAPISVAYSVPESTLGGVRSALTSGVVKVSIVPHSTSDNIAAVTGHLDFVDNSVDPTTGTILLKALFENGDRQLWPGEFVDVTTTVGEAKQAVLVPNAAIQNGQGGSQVYVVRADRTVEVRAVKLGLQLEDSTVLTQGVKSGETVVVDGQLRLVPGSKIEEKILGEDALELAKSSARKTAQQAGPKS